MSRLTTHSRRRRILGPSDFNFRRYGDINDNLSHVQNIGRYEIVHDLYNGFLTCLLEGLTQKRFVNFGDRKILLLPDLSGLFCLLEAP